MLCELLPHDAKLKKFAINNNVDCRLIWNKEQKRNNIKLLDDLYFLLPSEYKSIIILKKDFISDGGSIPRIAWTSAGSPFATRSLLAYLLHDGLYGAEYFTREICDWLFLELMEELNVNWWGRNKKHQAVRLFGSSVWEDHTYGPGGSVEENRKLVEKLEIVT